MPRIMRAADGRRMAWKNGGGETVELLAHPPGAGLDAFDWRISMARVAVDGPFSGFPGIDRTLTVLDGEGLVLALAGQEPVRLTPDTLPFRFAADAPCTGRLLGGPVTDLNVMTRRGRFAHTVAALDIAAPVDLKGEGFVTIVLCRSGDIMCRGLGTLARHDVVALDAGEAIRVEACGQPAAALVVSIRRTAAHTA